MRDPRVTTFVQDGRFFLQASPNRYDIITGEPPPLKVAGAVNLYTEQFFSLMKDRLKDGGIASFWLPIYQLTSDDTKAILRAFQNVFPNASLWATSDLEWIMIGIKPPISPANQELTRGLWTDSTSGPDLARIGLELPEQMFATFLMDAEEISLPLTNEVEPLTDFYPKRLSDAQPNAQAAWELGLRYLKSAGALHASWRLHSFAKFGLTKRTGNQNSEPFFFMRETRYRAEAGGSNWLAELDLYLRTSRLRGPILEVQNTDEFG